MKIGIIVAMDKELNLLIPVLGVSKQKVADGYLMHEGKIGNHEVVVVKCGIGKVNSALTANALINAEHPDLIVNTGVAGGAGNGVKIGQLLVAEYAAYHDVWCGPGTEIGAADGCVTFLPADNMLVSKSKQLLDPKATVYGLICSGDKFITTAEEVKEIKKSFPSVMAVDMESASIAQVCSIKGIPFNILRVVSDTPGEGENLSQYQNFWVEAPEKTFHAVKQLLESLS